MTVPTPNLIKLQDINLGLEKLQDRIMELTGERTKIETQFKFGEIDETLLMMKLKCLEYEMLHIIQPKFDNLVFEHELVSMLMDTKVQLSEN